MGYLLSIVVPTKDRYQYLEKLVELIIGFQSKDIELIIQDNSSNNHEYQNKIRKQIGPYTWIKYQYCEDKLTSIQNFDLAIKKATGKYVCFIGDDDGVTRYILDCARWMEKHNIEAVRSAKTYYNWPEVSDKGLVTFETSKKTIEFLNPLVELKHILHEGCQFLENIPVTYAGMVKREILDNIYNDYGTYFPGGASADISNGVALCFYVKRYAKINIPFIITGTSKQTGGVANRSLPILLSQVPFISPTVVEQWEGFFPQYWLGPIVWPESAIKSLRALRKESFILYLNHDKVLARCIVKTRLPKEEYAPYMCSNIRIKYYVVSSRMRYFCNGSIGMLIKLFTCGTKGLHQNRAIGVLDIVAAEEKIVQMCQPFSLDYID